MEKHGKNTGISGKPDLTVFIYALELRVNFVGNFPDFYRIEKIPKIPAGKANFSFVLIMST